MAQLLKLKHRLGYSDSKDEMRGETIHYAELKSQTTLYFDFPYDGGLTPSLVLRPRPSETVAMLRISRSNLTCDGYMRTTIVVKFDDGPIERLPVD